MTEVAYFSDFIKQHRSELPSSDDISSFVSQIISHINEVALDYALGDYSKWVDPLIEPNVHGITISRQEAIACVASLCEERERIVGLARLFAQEVSHYDRAFGPPPAVADWNSSKYKVQRASFLFGLALGSAPIFDESATIRSAEIAPIQKKWSLERIVIVITLLLDLNGAYLSNQPDAQMTELIDLQKQEIATIQQIDEKFAAGVDQIGDWIISFKEAYEERTQAVSEQTEAIKDNTRAVDQLIEKLEEAGNTTETQRDDTAETLPESD